MKITYEDSSERFDMVHSGKIFIYNNKCFLKINLFNGKNAYSFAKNDLVYFQPDMRVIPKLGSEIIVKD